MEEDKLLRKRNRALADKSLELQASTCRKLGELYVSEQRYEEALEMFKEECDVYEKLGKVISVAVANRMIGEVYSILGEYKEALKYQKKHLELAKAVKDLTEEQRALATIGRTYFCMAETMSGPEEEASYKRALREAKQAYLLSLRVCDKLQDVGRVELMQMRGRLMLNIGLVLECQGDVQKGIEHLKKAISINVKEDLFEDTFRCYFALAMIYHRQKDYIKALRYLDLAQDVADRLADKVLLLCETLLSKAEIYFSQGNFQGAKSALLKAYKLRPPPGADRESVEKNLKIALTLCQTEETLVKTRDEDYLALKKLYEVMGDGCCAVKNFEKALTYYHKMLECAEAIGDGGTELVPIYVSLSQTYKDNGEYDDALKYFHKELELWENNPAEACKTTINIAQLLELKGAGYQEVVETYDRAYVLAAHAESEKLETTVLRHLLDYQRHNGPPEVIEETEKRMEVIERNVVNRNESSEDEDEEAGTQYIGSNICLEELLEEQEGESEEYDRPRQTRKQNQGLKIKRNEKGETQLHVACINGNLPRVKKLLELGHPVNVQDNGGWLPLQEASNHGFVEIVEELLNHGAAINSPGGKGAGGVTALHDAASNGHLQVMELLLDHGALIDVHTDDNDTPLDCLMDWYSRRDGELPPEDVSLFRAIQARLKTALQKVGVTTERARIELPTASNESLGHDEPRSSTGKRTRVKRIDLRRALEDDFAGRKRWRTASSDSSGNEDSAIIRNRKQRVALPSEEPSTALSDEDTALVLDHDGALEYQRVIRGLRERHVPESASKVSERNVKTGNFLAEYEDRDDWLEDDLGDSSRANKRQKTRSLTKNDVSEFIGTSRRQSGAVRIQDDDDEDEAMLAGSPNTSGVVPIQERLPVVVRTTPRPGQQVSLLSTGFNRLVSASPSPNRGVEVVGPAIPTVKVRVEDRLLLVPIPATELAERTVGWLAKQAAERYLKLEGTEPVLTLLTKDGASLSADDPVSIVIDNDELLSCVTSWSLSPLPRRYMDACNSMDLVVDTHIHSCLQACEYSHALVLNELGLAVSQLKPVFQALRPQYDLQQLCLASNMLMDDGVECLVGCMSKLQALEVLDLSCNNVSSLGLGFISGLVSQPSATLPVLSVLNLSYNHFDEDWLSNLHDLLNALGSLRTLRLRSCGLTAAAFNGWSSADPPLLHISSVEELDISNNPLGEEGVVGFLRFLEPGHMVVLNVAGTGDEPIAGRVAEFLNRAAPLNLSALDLSGCTVTDTNLGQLLGCLKTATKLRSLRLCNNLRLSSVSLLRLSHLPSPPSVLDLSGCHNILLYLGSSSLSQWLHEEFLKKLQSLTITKKLDDDTAMQWEHVEQSWKQVWGYEAMVQKGPVGLLQLCVLNHDTQVSVYKL